MAEKDRIDGYTLIAKALKKQGAEVIYGIIGIPVTRLANMAQSLGIRYIGMRNEQAASYAAGAAGYLTKQPGICLTVAGPGFVHALAGLANATVNCFPMILMSGSGDPDKAGAGQGCFQEFDQISAARPFAKAVYRINSIEMTGEVIARAVRTACSGRPGGVYLDLPVNVLHQTVEEAEAETLSGCRITDNPAVVPSQKAIAEAVELLNSAVKPLLVIGKGAAYSRAEKELLQFIEVSGIPFLSMPMAKGLVPDNHGLSAAAARSVSMKEADVVIVAGARLNWMFDYGKPPKWGDECRFIQVDISGEEMDSGRRIDVPLAGDVAETFRLLNSAMRQSGYKTPSSWQEQIRKKSEENVMKLENSLRQTRHPMDFTTAFSVIRRVMGKYPETVLVTEGANTLDIGRGILSMNRPRKRLDTGTWGTMGIGMGYAIAAATVTGNPVLAVEGDAAFGFSGMELETICRYRLRVITVVFNNGGIYKGDEKNMYGGDPAPTRFVEDARYNMLIEAFGGKGARVETAEQLETALEAAFTADGPTLINCLIDPEAGTESGHMASHN